MGNETSKSGGPSTATTATASNTRTGGGGGAVKAAGSSSTTTTTTTAAAAAGRPSTNTAASSSASPMLNSPPMAPSSTSQPLPTSAPPRSSAPVALSASSFSNNNAAAAPLGASGSSSQRRGFLSSADIPVSASFNNTNSANNLDAVGSSVPRYVDASSMVYTLPSFTSETSFTSNNGLGGGGGGTTLAVSQAGPASAPMPVQTATSGAEFRVGGAPSSPLSPSRRHFPVGSASSPIAIPTYNTTTTSAVEDLSCSSPVLRSYRQHSFSTSKRDTCLAKSPTSPPVTFFGASSFTASASEAPMTMLASSSSTAAGAGGGTAIHTKFLEITGHPLGLENYGNTCYCNSVIQLIYHCTPLRLRLLELYDVYQSKKGKPGFEEDTVLYQLCSLIAIMHKSNNRSKEKYSKEKIAPRELLQCVRKRNEIFNNDMQQDAHEFTMFLLNDITETEQRIMADPGNVNLFLQHEAAMKKKSSSFSFWKHSKDKTISASSQKAAGKHDKTATVEGDSSSGPRAKSTGGQQPFTGDLTPLQVILQGQFGSLTACLECESVTARDEVFIDLSLETAQGCSLLRCLDHFGDPEYFWGKNKLRCDECKMAVRAAKTIHVQQLPQYALLIHLKRFQYDVKKQNFTKKADHVALPMQMDVEEYLTDPEVIEKNLRAEQARLQKDNASGSGGAAHKKDDGGSSATAGGTANKNTSPDTFKLASEEVRSKLRGVARHKARFELTGFVAHLGEGPNSGHYFTCVRYGPQLWRRFDDDTVSTMAERDVQQYFGVPSDATGVVTTTAYILLYERVA